MLRTKQHTSLGRGGGGGMELNWIHRQFIFLPNSSTIPDASDLSHDPNPTFPGVHNSQIPVSILRWPSDPSHEAPQAEGLCITIAIPWGKHSLVVCKGRGRYISKISFILL